MQSLLALLGVPQQAGGIVATPEQEAERRILEAAFPQAANRVPQDSPIPGDPIVVTADQRSDPRRDPQRPTYNDPANRDPIDPRYVLNDNRMSPHPSELEEIIPREGMFGTRGTLRDILGTLGDAFLVQGGADAVYRPQRQREQRADAMYGFTDNPLQAIERLSAAGFVDEAAALSEQYQAQQAREATLAQAQIENKQEYVANDVERVDNLRNYAARLLAAATSPERRDFALQQIISLAERTGHTLGDLGITANMTPEEIAVYAAGDMTVNQQESLQRRDTQLGISQQNADTARISATRPRAQPRPANPTAASIAAPLLDILERGGTLTPAQQEVLDRTGYSQDRGRIGRRRPAAPPASLSTGNSRFRIVN